MQINPVMTQQAASTQPAAAPTNVAKPQQNTSTPSTVVNLSQAAPAGKAGGDGDGDHGIEKPTVTPQTSNTANAGGYKSVNTKA